MTSEHPKPRLILAPLKGLTDVVFRNTFAEHFDGFDSALAPFVTTVAADRLTDRHVRDLLPHQNARPGTFSTWATRT
jgi:tRNA-dihydrouridine synthase B